VKFPLNETANGAATNTQTCLARAAYYVTTCGLGANVYVKATSIGTLTGRNGVSMPNGQLGQQYWAKAGCLVQIGSCPNHTSSANTVVMDTAGSAATVQSACLARAKDYVLWCAPSNADNTASATFFSSGSSLATKNVRNLCLDQACVGLNSGLRPQSSCFSNTTAPESTSTIIRDSASQWSGLIYLDGAGSCPGNMRATIMAWPGTGGGTELRAAQVWLERSGQGEIPGTRRAGSASFFDDLYSNIAATGGTVRACGTVAAGAGIGAASGCTAWMP
jgi:hypothetical protein